MKLHDAIAEWLVAIILICVLLVISGVIAI